jgi:hypothetical protein
VRILIATTYTPFAPDPSRRLVNSLKAELTARGVLADLVRLPFNPHTPTVADQTVAVRLQDVREAAGNRIDRLIAVGYPAFALPHPDKVAWFSQPPESTNSMWRSDRRFLRECRLVAATSWRTADRLRRFYRTEPHNLLWPPLPSSHPFRPGPFGDHLVVADGWELALDGLAFADAGVRLVVVGNEPPIAAERIAANGWGGRVRFTGEVSDGERAELVANSCGVVHLAPPGADPFGYAALEAFHAHKPVLTRLAAHGALELVADGENGLTCHPVAGLLGAAMSRLWRDRAEGERLGRAGQATLARAGVHWDTVVRGLTT